MTEQNEVPERTEVSGGSELDLNKAEEEAKSAKADALARRVETEMGAKLGKFAEKKLAKGKSRFWIVKKIAQTSKPFAKFRRREDILIIIRGIEEACDRQDEEACAKGIELLNRQNKTEFRMPVELARSVINDWVRDWRRKAGRPLADDLEGQELQKKKEGA